MGGHGGLNILPQKKWNVYNYDNRQIVDKDKKLHAQKQRRQFEQNRQNALDRKIEVLRGDGDSSTQPIEKKEVKIHSLISMQMRKMADEHQHVNLFKEEERILNNRQMSQIKRLREEEFLKDKNMDFTTRFLGTYADQNRRPWYAKKKGECQAPKKNKYFKDIQDVIYGLKTESKITKEIVAVQKREQLRVRDEERRDRTRQKVHRRDEDYQEKLVRFQKPSTQISKDLLKHEEDLLVREFKNDKTSEMEKLREQRLRREEKERKRAQALRLGVKQ